MARGRNARRVILADLRIVNRWMKWATNAFTETGTIYPGESGEEKIRARRPDEYIENKPERLRQFAAGARQVADAMINIAVKAEQRAAQIESNQ